MAALDPATRPKGIIPSATTIAEVPEEEEAMAVNSKTCAETVNIEVPEEVSKTSENLKTDSQKAITQTELSLAGRKAKHNANQAEAIGGFMYKRSSVYK